MQRERQQWQTSHMLMAVLCGLLLGFAISFRLILVNLWRKGDPIVVRGLARWNKQWTNRMIMPVAGRRNSPYAVIHHIGRRSGREYATPVIVASLTDGFCIPLIYGDASDWYRNLNATGQGWLEWQGKSYTVTSPELLEDVVAISAFPRWWRLRLSQFGITRFVKLSKVEARPDVTTREVKQQHVLQP